MSSYEAGLVAGFIIGVIATITFMILKGSIFWFYLRIYFGHLRRGVIPRRWPPCLVEPGRGKRPPTDSGDQLAD